MLDPHDGNAGGAQLVNDRYKFARFRVGQSRTDLIEQQDLGVRRQRSRKLQAFAIEET